MSSPVFDIIETGKPSSGFSSGFPIMWRLPNAALRSYWFQMTFLTTRWRSGALAVCFWAPPDVPDRVVARQVLTAKFERARPDDDESAIRLAMKLVSLVARRVRADHDPFHILGL